MDESTWEVVGTRFPYLFPRADDDGMNKKLFVGSLQQVCSPSSLFHPGLPPSILLPSESNSFSRSFLLPPPSSLPSSLPLPPPPLSFSLLPSPSLPPYSLFVTLFPLLTSQTLIKDFEPFWISNLEITPIPLWHGNVTSLGFVISPENSPKNFVYFSDFRFKTADTPDMSVPEISEENFENLSFFVDLERSLEILRRKKISVMMMDSIFWDETHFSHSNKIETTRAIAELKKRFVWETGRREGGSRTEERGEMNEKEKEGGRKRNKKGDILTQAGRCMWINFFSREFRVAWTTWKL
jgi:hypothetical protein